MQKNKSIKAYIDFLFSQIYLLFDGVENSTKNGKLKYGVRVTHTGQSYPSLDSSIGT